MIVGIPKEIKPEERRVALTPSRVTELVRRGHEVLVECGAGKACHLPDKDFKKAGARIIRNTRALWKRAEMIVKVKEPLPQEVDYIRAGQIIFSFLHLAANKKLTLALLRKKAVGIAYETIQLADGSLPVLKPMSEIAGQLSAQLGARGLEAGNGGRGILMGGINGAPPAKVTILGGGNAGLNAGLVASGMGASVTILEINRQRIRHLQSKFSHRVRVMRSTSASLLHGVLQSDVVICSVLHPGARAPRLVTREMVKGMKKGSVIVDIAIDQGGCCETIRPTTHGQPFYFLFGVVHCAITNLPSIVPHTSTNALISASFPYVLKIAGKGYANAASVDPAIRKGINVSGGVITNPAVAQSFGLPYHEI